MYVYVCRNVHERGCGCVSGYACMGVWGGVGGWAICSLYYMEYKQDSKTKSGDMSRPHARKTHHPSPSGTV